MNKLYIAVILVLLGILGISNFQKGGEIESLREERVALQIQVLKMEHSLKAAQRSTESIADKADRLMAMLLQLQKEMEERQ